MFVLVSFGVVHCEHGNDGAIGVPKRKSAKSLRFSQIGGVKILTVDWCRLVRIVPAIGANRCGPTVVNILTLCQEFDASRETTRMTHTHVAYTLPDFAPTHTRTQRIRDACSALVCTHTQAHTHTPAHTHTQVHTRQRAYGGTCACTWGYVYEMQLTTTCLSVSTFLHFLTCTESRSGFSQLRCPLSYIYFR